MNTENNKLIAEFMGWPYEKAYTTCNPSRLDKWLTPHDVKWLAAEWMKFHTDWNWLMPIVEKIYLMREVKDFTIKPGRVQIDLSDGFVIKSPVLAENTTIKEAYSAVVQFIQWYNQKNHP